MSTGLDPTVQRPSAAGTIINQPPRYEEGLEVYWIQHLSEGVKLGPFNMTMTAATLKLSRVTAYKKMKNSEAVNGWVIIKTENKQEA